MQNLNYGLCGTFLKSAFGATIGYFYGDDSTFERLKQTSRIKSINNSCHAVQ